MTVEYPKHFVKLKDRYPELIEAYESAGEISRKAGPLSDKLTHLVQMPACVALRSEGGVHPIRGGPSMPERLRRKSITP